MDEAAAARTVLVLVTETLVTLLSLSGGHVQPPADVIPSETLVQRRPDQLKHHRRRHTGGAVGEADRTESTEVGAQALAGNIFDTLLRDVTRRGVIFDEPLGYFRYDKVSKRIMPVTDETLIRRFRADCVLAAARPALAAYDPSDPPPARFVRHATAHRACPEQYTDLNAIVAVMLMTSMLREAQASGW